MNVDINPQVLIDKLKNVVATQIETICILEAEVERLRGIVDVAIPMHIAPTEDDVPSEQ
jgi:hypothetical protein